MDYDECFSESEECGTLLPTYYVHKNAQIRQLMESGFYEVEILGQQGEVLTGSRTVKDQFLHYIVRKAKYHQDAMDKELLSEETCQS